MQSLTEAVAPSRDEVAGYRVHRHIDPRKRCPPDGVRTREGVQVWLQLGQELQRHGGFPWQQRQLWARWP